MSSIRRFACAVLLAAAGGCMNPRIQANIAQNLNDIANELNAQRQDMQLLQEQVDSLKLAMAQKDSVIKRLINITGLPPGAGGGQGGLAEDVPAGDEPDTRYLNGPSDPEHRLRRRAP